MKILFFLIFFLNFSIKSHTQNLSNNHTLSSNILSQSTFNHFIDLFEQKRFGILSKEISFFQQHNQNNRITQELKWLRGNSLYQINNIKQAKSCLTPLLESTNIQIKQRALLDLAEISISCNDLKNAHYYLNLLANCTNISTFQEIAQAKLISLDLMDPNQSSSKKGKIDRAIQNFEKKYPHSSYINQLRYFYALYQLQHFHPQTAREYAIKIISESTNDQMQRLLGEIELADQKFTEAQKYFLPLTKTNNPFQEEAIYKSALIYKLNQDFSNSQILLTELTKYHKNSMYYERALAELASVNIILKKYDDALKYYLFESGFTGTRKANALLKITEIYYLKGDTLSARRTANRIQREFPYSSYANEAIYWVGRSYMTDKEYQKSIEQFDDYLLREPQSLKTEEIAIFLGHSYVNINNLPKARTYFQQIIRYSTNNQLKRNALLGIGRTYSQDEPIRSLEYYDQIWKNWPDAAESDQALYFAGATRYNLRDNKKAIENFIMLTNKFPLSPLYADGVLALAKLEFKTENFQNVLDIEKINSSNTEILSEFKEIQARSFFRIKDYSNALPLFQESSALTKIPDRKTELFLAEASTLRNLERYDEAVILYQKFLNSIQNKENPLQEILWQEIITSYIEANKLNDADQMLNKVEELFPNSIMLADLHSKLGDSYATDKNFNKAIIHYQKIPMFTTKSEVIADANFRETWAYYESKKPEALLKLEEFLTTYPKHYSIPNIMYALSSLKNDDNLKEDILNKFSSSPEAEQVRNDLEKKYSTNSSIEELYNAISHTKDKSLKMRYLYMLGQKFEQNQDYDSALQIFLDIHSVKDSIMSPKAAFHAAEIYNKQEDYKKSLRLYINIISQYDEKYTPKALDRIIEIYTVLNEKENTEKFIKRLQEKYPHSPEAKKWL